MKNDSKIKYSKICIIYCVFFFFIFYGLIAPLYSYCGEVQTITITKEDIMNAKPKSPYPVLFDNNDLKVVEIMEKRHFEKVFCDLSDNERLKNLEYDFFGRTWEFTPQKIRIEKLKIASSNVMLSGTALPPSINSKRYVKKMRNDSLQLRDRDNVGLIDGFLRLLSPEKYKIYRKNTDLMYEKYDFPY